MYASCLLSTLVILLALEMIHGTKLKTRLPCKLPSLGTVVLECKDSTECCAHFSCKAGVCLPGKASNATSLAMVSRLISQDAAKELDDMRLKVNEAVAAVIKADGADKATVLQEASNVYASFTSAESSVAPDKIIKKRIDVVDMLHKVVESGDEVEAVKSPLDRIAELEKEVETLKGKLKGCSCENTHSPKKTQTQTRTHAHTHGYRGLPKQGMEGGPCGKTNYKDFGKCKEGGKDLFCQSAGILFGNGWIPGTCMKKQEHAKLRRRLIGSFQVSENATIGSLNGPCGQTPFFDFGNCPNGTICTRTQPTEFAPGLCKEDPSQAPAQAISSLDETPPQKAKAVMNSTRAAELAAQTAMDVVDALDGISQKMLGVAAHLKAAALEFAPKADQKGKGGTSGKTKKAHKKHGHKHEVKAKGHGDSVLLGSVERAESPTRASMVDMPLAFIFGTVASVATVVGFRSCQQHRQRRLYQRV